MPESRDLVSERAVKARIVQYVVSDSPPFLSFQISRTDERLEQERKELLHEGRDLDKKIEEIKARLAAKQCESAQERTDWLTSTETPHLTIQTIYQHIITSHHSSWAHYSMALCFQTFAAIPADS